MCQLTLPQILLALQMVKYFDTYLSADLFLAGIKPAIDVGLSVTRVVL